MKKIRIVWTLKHIEKQKIAVGTKEIKGYFLWLCTAGVVDRIVGYHNTRGWIADICYGPKRNWVKDFFRSVFHKKGSIHITRFI
jgi:hypothetical protein